MPTARTVTVRGASTPPDVVDLSVAAQADYDAREASAPAADAQQQARQANSGTLRAKIQAAIADNAAFLGNPTPSPAQLTAQVRGLTRQNVAFARLLAGVLDSTDGT